MRRIVWIIILSPLLVGSVFSQITISIPDQFQAQLPTSGRLFLIFANAQHPEPRFRIGSAGPQAIPFFAIDVKQQDWSHPIQLPDTMLGYPVKRLRALPVGNYVVQAVLDVDTTFSYLNAPGNLFSRPVSLQHFSVQHDSLMIELTYKIPPETLPENTRFIQFVQMKSRLLSRFWKREVFLRAGIILPRTYHAQPGRKFPVVYRIGGFHTRYTAVQNMMQDAHPFKKAWEAADAPQFIVVQLDGEAPFGDSYQMNSANNGPYMYATLKELIPYIERKFRTYQDAKHRFLTGESTGGWVSLALQIWNPTYFNGAWSFCPDAVDFHYLQLVDIYQDTSAFYNEFGYVRPSMRQTDGEPVFSIQQEIWMENVMGRTNRYVASGGQWGSWNAVYGPRGKDGLPRPIWDPWTGRIDTSVVAHWRRYDLLAYLKSHWSEIGAQLQGKLHIWMGDMDSFYLNNALRNLAAFLKAVDNPPSDARIFFQPGAGHCWHGITWTERLQQMQQRLPGQ